MLHQELLKNYKHTRRYPRGEVRLKYNPSLHPDNLDLQWNCNSVLGNASLKLHDILLKTVKEISKEQTLLRNGKKAKISVAEFRTIQNYVSQKIESLFCKIRYR